MNGLAGLIEGLVGGDGESGGGLIGKFEFEFGIFAEGTTSDGGGDSAAGIGGIGWEVESGGGIALCVGADLFLDVSAFVVAKFEEEIDGDIRVGLVVQGIFDVQADGILAGGRDLFGRGERNGEAVGHDLAQLDDAGRGGQAGGVFGFERVLETIPAEERGGVAGKMFYGPVDFLESFAGGFDEGAGERSGHRVVIEIE